jgi:hypothetical protein
MSSLAAHMAHSLGWYNLRLTDFTELRYTMSIMYESMLMVEMSLPYILKDENKIPQSLERKIK